MRKEVLQKIIKKYPECNLTRNKYKAITLMLKELHPEIGNINNKILLEVVFNAIHADRDWRKLTEGNEQELKEILSQDYQINELGYTK